MLSINNINDVYTYYENQLKIKNDMIDRAIKASYNMLSLDDFIKETGFIIPNIMDLGNIRCYHADIPVLITRQLIESFGYSGELKTQKIALLKLIRAHNLPYIQLNNEEYKNFTSSLQPPRKGSLNSHFNQDIDIKSLYPQLGKVNGKATHIMMMPRDLNKLMMVVNTSKGDLMREFCQILTELFDLYLNYQNSYKSQQIAIKDKRIDELLEKMDSSIKKLDDMKEDLSVNQEILLEINNKFEIAVDDRAPKTKSVCKRDKVMIIEINKDGYPWKYYIIRVQHGSLNRTLKKLKIKYPNYTELITIPYQPNGINFYNLVKEKLEKEDHKIVVNRNEIKLRVGYTREQFIQDIRDLDMSKKDIEIPEDE